MRFGLLRGHGLPPGGRGGRAEGRSRRRARVYNAGVLTVLRRVRVTTDCLCGKRLAAVLPETIAVLERYGELQIDVTTPQKLCAVSAASIDRLLAAERRRLDVRGRGGTKPATLLTNQIPVGTLAEWDQTQPGFVEIDLVGHDGGYTQGDFCQTLVVTDVARYGLLAAAVSGREETRIAPGTAAARVGAGASTRAASQGRPSATTVNSNSQPS